MASLLTVDVLVWSDPRIVEEHVTCDGHGRNLPQSGERVWIHLSMERHVGKNRLFPPEFERWSFQTSFSWWEDCQVFHLISDIFARCKAEFTS